MSWIREEREPFNEYERPHRRHADADPQRLRIEAPPRRHAGVEDEDRDRANPEGERLHSGLRDGRDRGWQEIAPRAAEVRRGGTVGDPRAAARLDAWPAQVRRRHRGPARAQRSRYRDPL